ncbi:hypothetical protein MRB53_022822 [Persea americana]|uniref:Uncharacterized protein n=1 Tax=Persea americana TaxID=3435 RepID=A0ACC2L7P7_PERAE|nr:hypothetical protein MRB53_022822 [Persea americana]
MSSTLVSIHQHLLTFCLPLLRLRVREKLNYRSGGLIQFNSPRIRREIFKIDVEIRKLKLFELLPMIHRLQQGRKLLKHVFVLKFVSILENCIVAVGR